MDCRSIEFTRGRPRLRHGRGVWTRSVAAGLVLVLLTTIVQAGQPASAVGGQRVRVTGLRQYELPGVLTLDGDSVSLAHGVTIGKTTIHVAASPDGPLTLVRPGTRLVGRATSATGGILELRLEGAAEPARIPLDSIQTLERSERRPKRHVVRGILAGIGAFYLGVVAVFAACGLGCDDVTAVLGTFGPGIAAGVWAGRSSPSEQWTPVPINDFVSQFEKQGQLP